MMEDTVTNQVFTFIHKELPPPIFSGLSPKKISLTTDLRTDLRMLGEDAEPMIEKFFQEFSIKNLDFDLLRYFPPEGLWLFPSFKKRQIPIRLTIGMLVKAAKNNEWNTSEIEKI